MKRLALTDRQQVLFDRLVTLGEWARNGELPFRVIEIRGFGSFFRGKPRPTDVDLIVRVQWKQQLPEFQRFVQLVDAIDYDYDLEERFEKPADAVAGLFSERNELVEGISGKDAAKFIHWLKPYSWNMLRPQTMFSETDVKFPSGYAKRMIKAELPKLNVIHWLNEEETRERSWGLRCGFTVSVWSEEHPDTAGNLTRLLSEESVTHNLSRELAYFEVQIPLMHAQVALVERQIELLFKKRQSKKDRDDFAWLKKWSENEPRLEKERAAREDARAVATKFDAESWSLPPKPLSSTKAHAVAAADELRTEIKNLYLRLDRLKELRYAMVFFLDNPTAVYELSDGYA